MAEVLLVVAVTMTAGSEASASMLVAELVRTEGLLLTVVGFGAGIEAPIEACISDFNGGA